VFGDFKIEGQVMKFAVKYADEFVLPAKEETVLQGMIDSVTEYSKIEKTYAQYFVYVTLFSSLFSLRHVSAPTLPLSRGFTSNCVRHCALKYDL
jgi:hypothetical protein